jgi:two-component system, sensor histidine kinase and response regulator
MGDMNHQSMAGKTKVLIADDERDLVEMVSYNLEKKGYQILKAYDGGEAWKQIEAEKPDLLILDLMMPELDGWELCRLIRGSQKEEIKDLGILMLTARVLPEDRVYGLELGADDYLTKPFSISELILRVGKIARKRKAISGLYDEMEGLRLNVKSKEETLHKIVHDLKTPLISMGASAKLLLSHQQHEQKLKFLENIYDNTVRLTRWIDDTLKFQRSPLNSQKEEMKRVDIQSLVEHRVECLKGHAMEKKVEFLYQAGPSVPAIQGYEPSLQRAIENLISNAIKYTPGGGRVEISVIPYLLKEGGGVVEISVKDTGIGIAAEDHEKIFEPFYRGKNASSESGVGLGLSLVKEVVDLHGGKILVQSELNQGSIFSILLPVGNDMPVGKNIEAKGVEESKRNVKELYRECVTEDLLSKP